MQHQIEAVQASREPAGDLASRRAPEAAPDALLAGIRWGLLFAVLGFWLPVALIASRGLRAA